MTGEMGFCAGVEEVQREGPASSAQPPKLSPPLVPRSCTLPRLLLPPVLSEVLVPQGQQDEVTLAGLP